jgi:hypothetical protein
MGHGDLFSNCASRLLPKNLKNRSLCACFTSNMALKPFLRFRASRPGLFYDLSAGDSCPLRIPLAPSRGSGLGAAVSPADKSGKQRRPPASHSEKAPKPFSLYNGTSHYLRLLKTDPHVPTSTKAKLAFRQYGGAWGYSKGRIFRIKFPLICAAARVAVCIATAKWNPLPYAPAGRREGRLQHRSRCGLEKSAMPSLDRPCQQAKHRPFSLS